MSIKFEAEKQTIAAVKFISQGGFCPKEVAILMDDVEVERHETKDNNLE